MEKFCPLCGRVYGVEATSCEVDSERLVVLREEPSLVGVQLDGKYHLLAKLGEGGMGSVYLAQQKTMGREVAVKVLRREFSQNRLAIQRFLREARAASKLDHPNTITVYDFGQSDDGLLYLVMERLTGQPLGDILDAEGAFSVERAVHVMGQICDSLSEAHDNGITHRDLKPENIFILQKAGNPDFVKVLDFGIAKMAGDDVTQATATGMICGTPAYMSPEQAMGKNLDGRSDIYALGVLMFELLSDQKPYDGDAPMEVMLKHINEPIPDIFQRTGVSVPEGLQRAIEKMLSKRVAGRPADCQEVKALLLAGKSTPLIGPVTSTAKVSLERRKVTAEQDAALEKTGLSFTAPPLVARQPAAPVASRRWLIVAAALVFGGVAAALLLASSGRDAGTPAHRDGPVMTSEHQRQSDVGTPRRTTAEVTSPSSDVVDSASDTGPAGGAENIGKADVSTVVGQGLAVSIGAAQDIAAPQGDVESDGPEVAKPEALGEVVPDVAEALALVTITLTSRPAGGVVYEDGKRLGVTPLAIERVRDSAELQLVVRRQGYKARRLQIGTSGNLDKEFSLVRKRKVMPQGRRDSGDEVGTF